MGDIWYAEDGDGRGHFSTSGSEDGALGGIDGFWKGGGMWERGEGKGVTCSNSFREKSETALMRQHAAEAKFKALAKGTPANLSGLKAGRGGGRCAVFGAPPDTEQDSTVSSEADTNAAMAPGAKKAKGKKKFYIVEVCLAANPAAKPSAGGATKVQKPKAAKPSTGAVAKEEKLKAAEAPNHVETLRVPNPMAAPAASSGAGVAGTGAPAAKSADAAAAKEEAEKAPAPSSADDAATGEEEETALRCESRVETPAKGGGGEPDNRETESPQDQGGSSKLACSHAGAYVVYAGEEEFCAECWGEMRAERANKEMAAKAKKLRAARATEGGGGGGDGASAKEEEEDAGGEAEKREAVRCGAGEVAPGSDPIGWKIRKSFAGFGWFYGEVVAYNSTIEQYRVIYYKGHSEDLVMPELVKVKDLVRTGLAKVKRQALLPADEPCAKVARTVKARTVRLGPS
ncbi:hypothetical protein T484DRAFT_1908815 [Baffinella frigidus]|nr:hypothetical protein T484DRAFT_1908815 [Cryptophyta sp. CCMP2293]